MHNQFDSPVYRRSRTAYVIQCTLEHLLGLMMADAFLAKLLSHLGLSDAMVGIVSSFTSMAFVFQLMSIFLVQSRFSTKKIVIFADVTCQFLFMLIYFVPFLPLDPFTRKYLVMGCIMVGHATKCIISSLYFKWANTYVSEGKRAIFSARKECISLICGIVFAAVMGHIIDKYESIGNIEGGFLFIATAMLIINIANFISFLLIRDENPESRSAMRIPGRELLAHIRTNQLFRRYMLIGILGSVGGGLLGGFLGIYKTKDLALGVFTVQVINIAADFLRMAVSGPFARFSTKHGFSKGIQLSQIMSLIGNVIIIFTAPATRWLIVPYTLLTTAALAGSYQNSLNISYVLLPGKYLAQCMAIHNTISGIVSFLSSIVGGWILSAVQANGNMVLGIPLRGQQLLAFLALALGLPVFFLYDKYIVKPTEIKTKE